MTLLLLLDEPPDPAPTGASYIEGIRERPPLRLNIDVESPDGRHSRWAWDDPNPANVPMSLSFSSTMPGGFERMTCSLERDPRLNYPDLAELSTITVQGAGGDIAWQGRLEKTPDTGGFQAQVSPEAVGWQAHLEDDNSAREIYVDRELSRWEDMSLTRKIEMTEARALFSPSTVGGTGAVETGLTGSWTTASALCDAWYDARGISIGEVYAWWERMGNAIDPKSEAWELWDWEVSLSSVDHTNGSIRSGNLRAAGPSSVSVSGSAGMTHAILSLFYGNTGGEEGLLYAINWPVVAVYGMHGLQLVGVNSNTEAKGVLASDVLAHALSRWAPKLAFTTGPECSIKPSSFVIPQLAFLEPTTVAEILKQSIRFELQDWAVWEGPRFYMNPRGEGGKEWRARVGPAQLQEAGPQVARLWNGVVVTYTDTTGVTRTAGPLNSGMNTTSSLLEDTNPENPLNEAGIKRWAALTMGTSTAAGAEQVGAIFLRESKALETSGQATLVGHVEDEAGVLCPAWKVKAGDTVSFVDASDSSPRRIVNASYDDPTKTTTVQLDQPPDSLQALLERLSVVLAPLGL